MKECMNSHTLTPKILKKYTKKNTHTHTKYQSYYYTLKIKMITGKERRRIRRRSSRRNWLLYIKKGQIV